MPRIRYARTLEEVRRAREGNPEFLSSRVSSLRAVYETDPARVAAVLPQPLKPSDRPEVSIVVSSVAMEPRPGIRIEIGSAVFGVRAFHDGVEGAYMLTMPMTSEQAVIGGRETYGEPKKLAEIQLRRDGERIGATVTRMGTTYLELRGTLGEALGPREYVDYAFCFKALPSCEPGRDFDADPLLVQLEWRQKHTQVRRVEGEVILRESPFDPVADLPVRRLARFEYDEGTTQSTGRVLRSVPGEWLLPFLHQRYDQPGTRGVEVA